MIQCPRSTGEVVVPLAVTLRTLACVISPPRTLSAGSFTLRKFDARDALDAVMVGQPLVEEREVRIDDVPRRQVGPQQLGEEQPRLLDCRQLQRVVEFVVVVKRGGRRRVVDLPQVEPVVGERLDEPPRLRVVEHPLGLRPQHVRLAAVRRWSASARSVSSGTEFHRNRASRVASAWSSSWPGFSSTNTKPGDDRTAVYADSRDRVKPWPFLN